MTATLLALTLLDAQGDRYLEKAASLALTLGARLRLAYCSDGSRQFDAPLARLQQRTRHLARRFEMPVDMVHEEVRSLDTLRACVERSTLTCIAQALPGSAEPPQSRDLLGRLLGQLVRQRKTPVLVIRPETHGLYRKVLVPVSTGPESASRVRWALALSTHARIDLLHKAAASGEPLDTFLRLRDLTRGLDELPRRFQHTVANGPLDVILAEELRRNGQDLVIVGNTPESLWSRLLRPPPALRLVAGLPADVLVVPRTGAKAGMGWPQDC